VTRDRVADLSDGDGSTLVLVRVVSVNYDRPPDRQRRSHYELGERSETLIAAAVSQRLKEPMAGALLQDLAEVAQLRAADLICRRDYGAFGYLELTVVEAAGRLAARFTAIRTLPEYERDVYADALIDDHLADREEAVATVRLGELLAPSDTESQLVLPALSQPGRGEERRASAAAVCA
jgi:hypothetical protein